MNVLTAMAERWRGWILPSQIRLAIEITMIDVKRTWFGRHELWLAQLPLLLACQMEGEFDEEAEQPVTEEVRTVEASRPEAPPARPLESRFITPEELAERDAARADRLQIRLPAELKEPVRRLAKGMLERAERAGELSTPSIMETQVIAHGALVGQAVARVRAVASEKITLPGGRRMPGVRTTLRIVERVAGDLPDEFQVEHRGGANEHRIVSDCGQPQFTVGAEYLVFPSRAGEGWYIEGQRAWPIAADDRLGGASGVTYQEFVRAYAASHSD
ncbi:hypothetical protein [Nannocystis punicea]|uniref:Uncharacterized protein n=1 Tax=Nannocystis punicea TaxID=2995304 RepID=A0ABY7H4L8_9BACT|nr:hypothetical protein [Nannocystis poenicansa]WAS94211.1 hypothetical protein O0S08_49445 [Nannocystis poenicansa]